jgi:mycothiol synthase
MDQLMMIRAAAPVPEVPLPAGWTIRSMRPGEGGTWARLCGGEFWDPQQMSDEERWAHVMAADSGVKVENVFFVCEETGEPVATATAKLLDTQSRAGFPPTEHPLGYLHYVAALPLCRGKGAGSAVTAHVLRRLAELGYPDCVLTTDDARLAAVRSYLRLGYVPVLRGEDMRGRWQAVLSGLGMTTCPALDAQGRPAEPIVSGASV